MHSSRFQDAEQPGTTERPLAEKTARALIASAEEARKRKADSTQESISLQGHDGHVRIAFNGTPEPLSYYQIRQASVAGQQPLYVARHIGGRWFVVHGGKEGPHVDEVGVLTNADGVPLYTAKYDGRWYILLSHEPMSKGYHAIYHVFARPKAIVAIARRGKEYFDVLIPLRAS